MTIPSPDRAIVEPGGGVRTRAPRRGAAPTVSVVVASSSDRHQLQTCLASILEQSQRLHAQIVVARAALPPDASVLSKLYPGVTFLDAPAGASTAEMRALGMGATTGDIVAITEDQTVHDADWLETLMQRAIQGGVTGPMHPADLSKQDLSGALSEYGFIASGRLDLGSEVIRRASQRAGVGYGQRSVSDILDWARWTQTEAVPDDERRARQRVFHFASTAVGSDEARPTVAGFCRDRYEQGRAYALSRLARGGTTGRLVFLAATPLLPLALAWGVGKSLRKRRAGFVRTLPVALACVASWAAGEAVGYFRGPGSPDTKS